VKPEASSQFRILPRAFYDRPTLDVARDLIGKVLVHETRGRRTAGVIVETEAYIGESDPACHAAPGPTERNRPLYGAPGHAYVYLNYGIHYLVNAVTEGVGHPAAVLVRALAPIEGMDLMRRRRERVRRRAAAARALAGPDGVARNGRPPLADADLCRGPGNLTVALGIDLSQNLADLCAGPLIVEDHGIHPPGVDWSSRIGIAVGTEHAWRCAWARHESVSGGGGKRRSSSK
jgi:DNA-3-methyladenine glycosylase